jgi:hypothetical protein
MSAVAKRRVSFTGLAAANAVVALLWWSLVGTPGNNGLYLVVSIMWTLAAIFYALRAAAEWKKPRA